MKRKYRVTPVRARNGAIQVWTVNCDGLEYFAAHSRSDCFRWIDDFERAVGTMLAAEQIIARRGHAA